MSERLSPPGFKQDPARVAQRGAPLSITTSRPQADGSRAGQSPAGRSALPLSSPQRTISDPFPSPSRHDTITRASTGDTPKSAGYVDKSLRFAKDGTGDTSPSLIGDNGDKTKRRHSHEPKVNVHTECGRHSDDWLFGGFSVSKTVKKLWERDKKE